VLRKVSVVVVALTASLFAAPSQSQAVPDTTAPVLQSLTVKPTVVDTRGGAREITFEARITDDASGFEGGYVQAQRGTIRGERWTRVSGDANDGIYRAVITWEEFDANGDIPLYIFLQDKATNGRNLFEQDLRDLGLPDHFTATTTPDTAAPVLESLAISPATLDSRCGDVSVTFTARITDELSGFEGGYVQANRGTIRGERWTRVSGDANDGIYHAVITWEEFDANGDIPLYIFLQDKATNGRNLFEQDLRDLELPDHFTNSSSPAAPCKPAEVVASRSDQGATVSWSKPSDNGDAISGFVVTSSPDGVTKAVDADTTTTTVPGLRNGTPYRFTVTATNGIGTSEASDESNQATPAGLAFAPTQVAAAQGDESATVSWTEPNVNGSPITGYTVTSSPGGAAKRVGPDATRTTVNGLDNGTGYSFTVVAHNGVGTSNASAASNAVTPAGVPKQPTRPGAERGDRSVNVTWDAPPANGSAITGYVVRLGNEDSKTVPADARSVRFSGLENGRSVEFTVAAVNAIGEGPESDESQQVTPAGVPITTAKPSIERGNREATLTWDASNENGAPISGYLVTMYPGGQTFEYPAVDRSARVTDLTNGTRYSFTVRAKNNAGLGAESPQVSITPAGATAAPTKVVATRNDRSASVTWTKPDDNGSPITGYTITSEDGQVTKTVDGDITSTSLKGLANGTRYRFTVTATNDVGVSPKSDFSNTITPAGVTDPPRNVVAKRADESAVVSWTKPDNNGSAITTYTVRSNPGSVTKTVHGDTATTTVPGLTNGTEYTFTVTSTNDVGTSPASVSSSSVTPAGATAAPTKITATRGDELAAISWVRPANNGSPITGYTITSSPGGIGKVIAGNADSATVDGLTNGTDYTFTVRAINDVGTSPASEPSNAITPAGVPTAATDVTATRGNKSASVSWAKSAPNGAAILSYTITSTPGGVTRTVDSDTTTATVAGLTNGTDYTFKITATNDIGTSPVSRGSNAVTPAGAPFTPTEVAAVRGHESALVSWTKPSSNGSPITGYTVTSSPGGVTKTVEGDRSSATVAGLTNGTKYTFNVVATNDIGLGSASDPSNIVTPAGVTVAPTTAAATPGDRFADLSWAKPADNGAPITGYTITSTPAGATKTVSGDATNTRVAGLTNGTEYTFTVRAINDVGTSPASEPSNAVTPAGVPTAATNIAATRGNKSASVSWAKSAPNGAPILSYTITSTPDGVTRTVDSDTATATVAGLKNGTNYTFKITATNAVGTSVPSDPSNPVTPAGVTDAPTQVTATAGNQSAVVTWNQPVDNGTPITGYTVTSSPGGVTKTVTANATSAQIPGLTNDINYTFTVTATNDVGTSAGSNPSNSVRPVTPPVPSPTASRPGKVSKPTVKAGKRSAKITWKAPSTNGAAIIRYRITTNYGKSITVSGNAKTAKFRNLKSGRKVTFKVLAINSAGSGSYSTASKKIKIK
jgi:hypothetical protein